MKNFKREKISDYWERIAQQEYSNHQLWRSYNDLINTMLINKWLKTPVKHILKTDLFDEAIHKGLYPEVCERTEKFTAIDISEGIVKRAVSRYSNLDGVIADVRSLPFADNQFDFVISNSTLDHFFCEQDIFKSLSELERVLCQNGKMIVTFDNLANPVILLRNFLAQKSLLSSKVVPYFVGKTVTPWKLEEYLKKTGFVINDVSTVMHFPRLLLKQFYRLHNIFKSMPGDCRTRPQNSKTIDLLKDFYNLIDEQFSAQKTTNLNSIVNNFTEMDLNEIDVQTGCIGWYWAIWFI